MKKLAQLTALTAVVTAAAVALDAGQNPSPAPPQPATAAQPPGAQQPQTPTFKLRVDYVEVDVVVTDRQGGTLSRT